MIRILDNVEIRLIVDTLLNTIKFIYFLEKNEIKYKLCGDEYIVIKISDIINMNSEFINQFMDYVYDINKIFIFRDYPLLNFGINPRDFILISNNMYINELHLDKSFSSLSNVSNVTLKDRNKFYNLSELSSDFRILKLYNVSDGFLVDSSSIKIELVDAFKIGVFDRNKKLKESLLSHFTKMKIC